MFYHTKSLGVVLHALIFCSILSLATSKLIYRRANSPDNVTGFDFAPDFSRDPAPPFPSLRDDQGKPIDIENLRVS